VFTERKSCATKTDSPEEGTTEEKKDNEGAEKESENEPAPFRRNPWSCDNIRLVRDKGGKAGAENHRERKKTLSREAEDVAGMRERIEPLKEGDSCR